MPPEGAVTASTTSKGKVKERRTPSTALELLRSLHPQIKQILQRDAAVRVPLHVMDVLKTEHIRPPLGPAQTSADPVASNVSMHVGEARYGTAGVKHEAMEHLKDGEHVRNKLSKVGAGVLFLGPAPISSKISDERRKLTEVCGKSMSLAYSPARRSKSSELPDGLPSDLVHRTFKQAGYITEQRPLRVCKHLYAILHRHSC